MKQLKIILITLIVGVCACAHNPYEHAQEQVSAEQYEQAIADLKQSLIEQPNNVQLRTAYISVLDRVMTKLQQNVQQQRNFGQYPEALQTIDRALKIDPQNPKFILLKADLDIDRSIATALQEAEILRSQGKNIQALQRVEQALKDAPRHTTLLTLQRSLQAAIRAADPTLGVRTLLETKPITLDFKQAPLSSVLDAITKLNGINFIFDRDVKQDSRVNVFLRQTNANDAIDLVLQSQALTKRVIDSKTVLIYPNTPEKQREHQEIIIRVFHLANAEAKSTAALLRTMLKIKEPYVDERANLIAIREPAEIVSLAERLVSLHDIADAEVMLDVEVLEVSSSKLLGLGINFPSSVTLTPLSATGTSTGLTLNALRQLNGDRIGANVAPLTLNLRSEKGDANVLANPRIRAKNREKAHIVIGDKVPVVTTTSSATGVIGESVNYLEVGLKLDVEPQVSPDEEVTLKVGLEVSSITQQVSTSNGGTAYQIGTRNASTTLRLRDGETQVLGGLISQSDKRSFARIPGLGDLPILGRIFGSQLDNKSNNELILAITPRIIRSAARPDLLQAQMWIGTEQNPKLSNPPQQHAQLASDLDASNTKFAQDPPTKLRISPTVTGLLENKLDFTAVDTQTLGQVFELSLNVQANQAIRGLPIELAYDTQKLQLIEVFEGDLLKTDGVTTSFSHAVNTAQGKVSTSILRSDNTGTIPSADRRMLLGYRFKSIATGQADIKVTHAAPISLVGAAAIVFKELPSIKINIK